MAGKKRKTSSRKKLGNRGFKQDNRERDAIRNRSHPYLAGLIGKPRGDLPTLGALKSESVGVIRHVLSSVSHSERAVAKYAGIPFPDNYDAFSPTLPTAEATYLRDELKWTTVVLSLYAGRVNEFLQEKAAFENAIIVGDIDRATASFDSILARFGCSLWTIECGTLLGELKGGIQENRRFLTGVIESTGDYYARVIGQLASQRTEATLTAEAYDTAVTAFFGITEEDKTRPVNIAYLLFKTHYYGLLPYSDDDLKYILNMDSSYALVDRYVTYIRVMMHLAATRNRNDAESLIAPSIALARHSFRDARLLAIQRFLTSTTEISADEQLRSLVALTDHYTVGNYAAARDMAVQGLLDRPTCFEYYDFFCKASIHLGVPYEPLFGNDSLRAVLLLNVYHVLARTPRTEDALAELRKSAYMLNSLNMANQLFSFVCEHSTDTPCFNPIIFREISSTTPTARFATVFSERTDAQNYLTSLGSVVANSSSVDLFAQVFSPAFVGRADALSSLPDARATKYLAIGHEQRGEFDQAIAGYENLLHRANANPLLESDAITGLYRCLLATFRLHQALDLVLDTYFRKPECLTSLSLKRLLQLFETRGDDTCQADLSWPVLYAVYSKINELPTDNKRLFQLQDTFLATHGCTRPSQLGSFVDVFQRDRLAFFLRYICVPEILDSSIDYSSTEDLENERISVCQLLLEIDPKNHEAFTEEIARLTQTQTVRDAILRVDTSKVYVDINGIRRSLDRTFHQLFDRYWQLHGVESRFRQSVVEVSRGGKRIEKRVAVVFVDAVVEMFNGLFLELRDRYISSNEYGLDSYLSLRIRHGTLAGQLRSLFETHHLITTKDVSTNSYHRNPYWTSHLDFLDADAVCAFDERLAEFSKRIDGLIDEVKQRWIQVRSTASNPEALFDFEYDTTELALLYAQFGAIEEVSEFLDCAFTELRSRAQRNLHAMQDAIRSTLRDKLLAALTGLEDEALAIDWRVRGTDFAHSIGQCRTDIQRELELIAGWFATVGDAAMPDYSIQHLINTSVEIIRRAYPRNAFFHAPIYIKDWMCPGHTFPSFVDTMCILIENAIRHARVPSPTVAIRVDGSNARGLISVTNDLPSDSNIKSLESLLPELKSRASAQSYNGVLRREGGSGYYKLGKLAGIDLRTMNVAIDTHLSKSVANEPVRFTVSISCDAREM